MARNLATRLRLARWLGPWTPETSIPTSVVHQELVIGRPEGHAAHAAPLKVWTFCPADREPTGTLFLVPGLHYLGPSDPRMERVARSMAASGLRVWAPFIPHLLDLDLDESMNADVATAFQALLDAVPGVRPGVFSISFGSILAVRLAADRRFADRVGGLLLFGGIADWRGGIRFSLTGELPDGTRRPADPLNQPVIFMSLLRDLPDLPSDPGAVLEAWRRYIRATWGDPAMKEPDRHGPIASAIAADLPDDRHRELFLQGCGLEAGTLALAEHALETAGSHMGWIDPAPHVSGIRAPVHIAHGADDDVIPYTDAHALVAMMPPDTHPALHLTGMYGHTGHTGLLQLLADIPALIRELRTMAGLLNAIVGVASADGPTHQVSDAD